MSFAPSTPATGIIDGTIGLETDGILSFGPPSIVIDTIDITTLPDDGGVRVTLTGVFPTTYGIVFSLSDPLPGGVTRACYSGISKDGGASIFFVVPPLPLAAYDLVVTPEFGPAFTLTSIFTVIHRSFASNLFSLRSIAGRPRNVGPYSMDEED